MATAAPSKRAGRKDLALVTAVLGTAFANDPHVRHLVGARGEDPAVVARFIEELLEHLYLPLDEVWIDGEGSSAAVWMPPGQWQVGDRAAEALTGPLFELVGAAHVPLLLRSLEAVDQAHPHDPHWYCPLVGTVPLRRGRGGATVCMAPVLACCDADGVPAYLETATESNLRFYGRLGFRVIGRLPLPDDGPLLWRMWRAPSDPEARS